MMFTIDGDKLDETIRIYNNETGSAASDGVITATILADWNEGNEHQAWLNEANPQEIADWLAAMTE